MACPLCHSSDQENTKPPETTWVSHAPQEGWQVTWGRVRVRVRGRIRVRVRATARGAQ